MTPGPRGGWTWSARALALLIYAGLPAVAQAHGWGDQPDIDNLKAAGAAAGAAAVAGAFAKAARGRRGADKGAKPPPDPLQKARNDALDQVRDQRRLEQSRNDAIDQAANAHRRDRRR